METRKIRVMLADDDAGLLDALADTVRGAADLELVGMANDTAETIRQAGTSRPDVVLMDVRMPGAGGIAAAREVSSMPGLRVVALSAHEDSMSVLQMLEAGAVGYIVKSAPEPEILDAIRRAHRGQMSMSSELGLDAINDLMRELRKGQDTGQLLRESEQLFHGILDSAPDAMVIVDASGLIKVVNGQTERVFGYGRAELRGQSVDVLLPERFRASHVRHRVGYLARPQRRPMGAALDLYGMRKDGSEFPAEITVSPMESESGLFVIAAVRDITDRRQAEKKEDEGVESVRRQKLFASLIAAQEEERIRIASDIHDDTIQAMTATSLRVQQLRRHLTDEKQIALLSTLEHAVHQSIDRLRRLLFDLRPPSLDRAGLASALRELLERLREDAQLTFTLENRLIAEPEGDTRTALYRIAQEALTNVKKHASAANVDVELRNADGGCGVTIRDDGHGFDVARTGSKPGHLGLVSMRERAQIAGGWWSVTCPPDGGTVVEFWLPLGTQTGEATSGRPA